MEIFQNFVAFSEYVNFNESSLEQLWSLPKKKLLNLRVVNSEPEKKRKWEFAKEEFIIPQKGLPGHITNKKNMHLHITLDEESGLVMMTDKITKGPFIYYVITCRGGVRKCQFFIIFCTKHMLM